MPVEGVTCDIYRKNFNFSLLVSPCQGSSHLCTLCAHIPRHPMQLPCGHYFCHSCIMDHSSTDRNYQAAKFKMRKFAGRLSIKPRCPKCYERYEIGELRDPEQFDKTTRDELMSMRIKCPGGCGFEGHAIQLNHHTKFACPRRIIRCPNHGCATRGPAAELEREHFTECCYHRHFCVKCRFPVFSNDNTPHDCFDEMERAIKALGGDGGRGEPGKTVFFGFRHTRQPWWAYEPVSAPRREFAETATSCAIKSAYEMGISEVSIPWAGEEARLLNRDEIIKARISFFCPVLGQGSILDPNRPIVDKHGNSVSFDAKGNETARQFKANNLLTSTYDPRSDVLDHYFYPDDYKVNDLREKLNRSRLPWTRTLRAESILAHTTKVAPTNVDMDWQPWNLYHSSLADLVASGAQVPAEGNGAGDAEMESTRILMELMKMTKGN